MPPSAQAVFAYRRANKNSTHILIMIPLTQSCFDWVKFLQHQPELVVYRNLGLSPGCYSSGPMDWMTAAAPHSNRPDCHSLAPSLM